MTAVRRRIPELTLIEHEFAVPLDHASPAGETLTIFAREVIGDAPGAGEFPLLVFFQGGPAMRRRARQLHRCRSPGSNGL